MPSAALTPQTSLVYDIGQRRYLNITGRCTLKCLFCPKHNGTQQLHEYQLALNHQPSAKDIIPLLGDIQDYAEYVFCGFGEPTLNLDTLISVAQTIKTQHGRVRVNTDGLGNLFHRRNILPELAPWVDSLSISLNADIEAVYNRHCQPRLRGAYQALLDFIALAPHYIDDVQVSAIDGLEGVNVTRCREIALSSGAQFKQRLLGVIG